MTQPMLASPREYMIDYLRAVFPIRQMRVFKDAAGATRSELMLDALIAHFGKDMVAEVTGRSRRIVPGSKGEQVLERRSASANLAEASVFMDGRSTILAFSDAGGTRRSYHADRGAGSAMRRRIPSCSNQAGGPPPRSRGSAARTEPIS